MESQFIKYFLIIKIGMSRIKNKIIRSATQIIIAKAIIEIDDYKEKNMPDRSSSRSITRKEIRKWINGDVKVKDQKVSYQNLQGFLEKLSGMKIINPVITTLDPKRWDSFELFADGRKKLEDELKEYIGDWNSKF